jgi:hypothetical protein
MECRDAKKVILDYLEGSLKGEEARSLEEHMASCGACCREKESFAQSWAMVGTWADIEPDPLYRAKFWEKAAVEEKKSFLAGLGDLFMHKRLAIGSLFSLLLVLGFLFMWRHTESTDWNSQANTAWNRDAMEHISAMVEDMGAPPKTAGAFLEGRNVIQLPEYVESKEGDVYPDLEIGKSSLVVMDGTQEAIKALVQGEVE